MRKMLKIAMLFLAFALATATVSAPAFADGGRGNCPPTSCP